MQEWFTVQTAVLSIQMKPPSASNAEHLSTEPTLKAHLKRNAANGKKSMSIIREEEEQSPYWQ